VAPPEADLFYIPAQLRPFAVRADSLVLDPANVKDHGERDLESHQASLRDFGIRRMVVVRRDDRLIEAGNGTVQAALRNGWEYVPVLFCDDDVTKAKAFALADNAVATLAEWDDENLKVLMQSLNEWTGELNLNDLVDSVLQDLDLPELADLAAPDEETSNDAPVTPVATGRQVKASDIQIVRRFVVTCPDEKTQLELMAELENRGLECELSNRRVR
jgi:hypothetical protein